MGECRQHGHQPVFCTLPLNLSSQHGKKSLTQWFFWSDFHYSHRTGLETYSVAKVQESGSWYLEPFWALYTEWNFLDTKKMNNYSFSNLQKLIKVSDDHLPYGWILFFSGQQLSPSIWGDRRCWGSKASKLLSRSHECIRNQLMLKASLIVVAIMEIMPFFYPPLSEGLHHLMQINSRVVRGQRSGFELEVHPWNQNWSDRWFP